MQFVITAYDGKNVLDKRMAVRPRHLKGMQKLIDHIVCAGGIVPLDRISILSEKTDIIGSFPLTH